MSPPFADAFLSPRQREQLRSGQLVVLNGGSSGANCSGSHPDTHVQQSLAKGFEVLEFAPVKDWADAGFGHLSSEEVLSQSMVLTRITGPRGTGLSGGQRQRVGLA